MAKFRQLPARLDQAAAHGGIAGIDKNHTSIAQAGAAGFFRQCQCGGRPGTKYGADGQLLAQIRQRHVGPEFKHFQAA